MTLFGSGDDRHLTSLGVGHVYSPATSAAPPATSDEAKHGSNLFWLRNKKSSGLLALYVAAPIWLALFLLLARQWGHNDPGGAHKVTPYRQSATYDPSSSAQAEEAGCAVYGCTKDSPPRTAAQGVFYALMLSFGVGMLPWALVTMIIENARTRAKQEQDARERREREIAALFSDRRRR